MRRLFGRYIFHQAPFSLVTSNLIRYFAGLVDSTQQISFDKTSPGKWWLCPRDGGTPIIIENEPSMIWHYGNAFEDEKTGTSAFIALTSQQFLEPLDIELHIVGTYRHSQSCTILWSSSSRLRLLLGSLFGILVLVEHHLLNLQSSVRSKSLK